MEYHENGILFQLKNVIKQSRPGYGPPILIIKSYAPDKRLCVVFYIKEYLNRTKFVRGQSTQLLISYKKPHLGVSKDTIARWIRTIMYRAGINTVYTAHSTRSAAVSAAKVAGVPIETIIKTAGWSSNKTFALYYDKPITQDRSFSEAILK
jgi:hypothetical protein